MLQQTNNSIPRSFKKKKKKDKKKSIDIFFKFATEMDGKRPIAALGKLKTHTQKKKTVLYVCHCCAGH